MRFGSQPCAAVQSHDELLGTFVIVLRRHGLRPAELFTPRLDRQIVVRLRSRASPAPATAAGASQLPDDRR
jgi:hypothetical protein